MYNCDGRKGFILHVGSPRVVLPDVGNKPSKYYRNLTNTPSRSRRVRHSRCAGVRDRGQVLQAFVPEEHGASCVENCPPPTLFDNVQSAFPLFGAPCF